MSVRTTRSDGIALRTMSRYDLLLALLPVSLLLGGMASLLTSVPDPPASAPAVSPPHTCFVTR